MDRPNFNRGTLSSEYYYKFGAAEFVLMSQAENVIRSKKERTKKGNFRSTTWRTCWSVYGLKFIIAAAEQQQQQ